MNSIFLTLLLITMSYIQSVKQVVVVDTDTKEFLIGVEMVSLNSDYLIGNSDINGKLQLTEQTPDGALILKYTGYESLVISKAVLSQLDTISLKDMSHIQTLGPTKKIPIEIINFHINPKSKIAASTGDVTTKSIKQSQIKVRDQRVLEFRNFLNKIANKQYDEVLVTFDIDMNGNLLILKILQYNWQWDKALSLLARPIYKSLITTDMNFGEISESPGARSDTRIMHYAPPIE